MFIIKSAAVWLLEPNHVRVKPGGVTITGQKASKVYTTKLQHLESEKLLHFWPLNNSEVPE